MISIRPAAPADADRMISILQEIAAERIYTAITKPWSAAAQRRHMAAFSAREIIHVAEADDHNVVGYQILELWAPTLDSMAHVGQVGTFIKAGWRGRGVGGALFRHTREFARQNGYIKFVIQVRARNTAGQSYYKRLGFAECGRLTRQVRCSGEDDDEIIMEYFL